MIRSLATKKTHTAHVGPWKQRCAAITNSYCLLIHPFHM